MSKKIEIEGINLNIKGDKYTLTVEEARELWRALNGLFQSSYYWYTSPAVFETTTGGTVSVTATAKEVEDET